MTVEAAVIEGVQLSNPDKILYPEQKITKRQLATYYAEISEWMLPHVADRPVTLVRCPTGRQKKCFYQRHAGSGISSEISEVTVPGFEEPYLYLHSRAGLISLAQLGVLEVHPWGARIDRPDRPDRVIFDLDPGEGLGFEEVIAAAHTLKAILDGMQLRSFAKTTGGKGLHVVIPIERRVEWTHAKGFARSIGTALAAEYPDRYLTRISKAERRGKIFIDYLRNDLTSTAVAPYSPRSRPGAPVATPLAWEEVAPGLDPGAFTIETVLDRLRRLGSDPWADMDAAAQRLPVLETQ
jgi:bifunctional non-homologous end joining protein LigD